MIYKTSDLKQLSICYFLGWVSVRSHLRPLVASSEHLKKLFKAMTSFPGKDSVN